MNRYVKNMFTQDFVLQKVYVKGEVSNCKYHPSGHIYFSLKDETGVLSCVMFAGQRRGLAFRMKNGDKVVAGGSVDVYERDGRYQLYAREITLEGAGALYERFLALKEELEEAMASLTERERNVIKLRFGLDDGKTRTLEEVGKEFNVTRERIRQIEAKALRKLRHPSRSRKLKDFLE